MCRNDYTLYQSGRRLTHFFFSSNCLWWIILIFKFFFTINARVCLYKYRRNTYESDMFRFLRSRSVKVGRKLNGIVRYCSQKEITMKGGGDFFFFFSIILLANVSIFKIQACYSITHTKITNSVWNKKKKAFGGRHEPPVLPGYSPSPSGPPTTCFCATVFVVARKFYLRHPGGGYAIRHNPGSDFMTFANRYRIRMEQKKKKKQQSELYSISGVPNVTVLYCWLYFKRQMRR